MKERTTIKARSSGMAVAAMIVVMAATVAIVAGRNQQPEPAVDITVCGGPASNWIGQRLPPLDHSALASDLLKGDWLVLFTNRGCSGCEILSQEFSQMAGRHLRGTRNSQIQFSIVKFGRDTQGGARSDAVADAWVKRLSLSPDAAFVPSERCVLHIVDSVVNQVYSPTELDLIAAVFWGK